MTKKMKIGLIAGTVLIVIAIGVGLFYQKNKLYFAPKTETNLFALGQVESGKGNHAEAVRYYRELLSKDPKHSIAMRFMLESLIQVGSKEEVLAEVDRLVTLDPSPANLELAVSAALQFREKQKADEYLERLRASSL